MNNLQKVKKPLFIISIGMVLLFSYMVFGSRFTMQASVCSPTFLQKAANNFDVSKVDDLKENVIETRRLKNYTSDANCLYVVLQYDFIKSDYKQAKVDYRSLEKVYRPSRGFDQSLGVDRKSLAQLNANVQFLKTVNDQFLKNTSGAIEP